MTKRAKVTFIAPIWNYHPVIISSLVCQRHKDWELLLVHDGPNDTNLQKFVAAFDDRRITYIETEKRFGAAKYGHPIREWALEEIGKGSICAGTDYVVVTNADNYYCPAFCDLCLGYLESNKELTGVYCESLTHNYWTWGVLTTQLQLGNIDVCCMMFRKEAACEVGWHDYQHSSDWTFIKGIMDRYGAEKIMKIPGNLAVHN